MIRPMRIRLWALACLLLACSLSLDFAPVSAQSDDVAQILARVNSLRLQNGLPPLDLSSTLTASAQRHSDDMARTGNVSHTGSDGSSIESRIHDAGYGHWRDFGIWGENIYGGQMANVDAAWNFWINSQVHRANLLKPRYREIGIGVGPSRESYLRADKILEVARKSGADAIHPGYGFLAEREGFAAACEDAGLAFIGPKPSSIAAMGDKMEARATVIRAGVPVVPGTEDVGNLSNEELLSKAPQIAFPLLIKATAGGGGKGMREVKTLEEMPDLLQSARREAESAFGDGNVYLEKLVEGARHI